VTLALDVSRGAATAPLSSALTISGEHAGWSFGTVAAIRGR
jgi:hypothetical protein